MSGEHTVETTGAGRTRASRYSWAEASLGAVVSAFGLIIFWEIAGLDAGPTYARIGPRVFPAGVATGLLLIGGGLMASAFLRPQARPMPDLDLPALLWVGNGLLAMILLIDQAGFVFAAAALFAGVARAFGSRGSIRVLGIGLTLALACQFGFSYGLGVELPWGLLSFLN